jgi:hypothetical protein
MTEMKEPSLRCSFCNKHQNEVNKLIAGPSVFICNECVDVCNDIVSGRFDEPSSTDEPTATAPPWQGPRLMRCPACGHLWRSDEPAIKKQ